jgi:hypothetical protein
MEEHVAERKYIVLGFVVVVQVALVIVAKLYFFPKATNTS